MTEFYKICIVLEHCIPRLCNGSTSDSGSDCGGSNPPWGTKRGCPERIIAVVNIIWQLSSLRTASFFWPLRITASTADSHSVNRSSILLGAINNSFETALVLVLFFLFKINRRESNCGRSGCKKASSAQRFCNLPPRMAAKATVDGAEGENRRFSTVALRFS